MAKTKKKGWININKWLPEESVQSYTTHGVYATKEEAQNMAHHHTSEYITTIQIEWEEEV